MGYDKQDPHAFVDENGNVVDEFGEVMMGKCCEVKCHEPWCGKNQWGANRDECMDIVFANQGSQGLQCPSGYLMTAIHDVFAKGKQHGVQKIDKISCCALHTIGAPTQAPSLSPSPSPTSAPTPAPTQAPSVSPSLSPSLSPSPSPTTAPSSHPTTSPTTAPT